MKLVKIPKNYVAYATKDFNVKNLNFCKVAKTWWGKNIQSIDNVIDEYDYKFKAQHILMIGVSDNEVYVTALNGKLSTSFYNVDGVEFSRKILTLLQRDDNLEIVKYDEIQSKQKTEFETRLKFDRICNQISFFQDERILKITRTEFGYKIITLESNGREHLPLHLDGSEFAHSMFYDKNKEIITGNPLK
jgi:hypothetical protein